MYFDASAILPIVIEEPTSAIAGRFWDEADRAVSSRLVYVEGRAALAMARRLDRLDERQLRTAVNDFEDLRAQLDMIEITQGLVGEAGALAEQFGLRSYAAVHLASARLVNDPEMVLAAGDQSLLAAARAAGIATADLNSRS